MAEVEEVERILDELFARLGRNDQSLRSSIPGRRVIKATCPDISLTRMAVWEGGTLTDIDEPSVDHADIRISMQSDDLVRLAAGELSLTEAYLSGRVRIDAPMSDLLRLRAAL